MSVCDNLAWNMLDCVAGFIASSWWKLRWGGPIISRVLLPFEFCCRRKRGMKRGEGWVGWKCSLTRSFAHSLAHSVTALIQHTRAHLAPREEALSLFNPHYSRGADSIWWVSQPCSVHLLHSPAHTYLPFISSVWLQFLLFFCSFVRAQGNQMFRGPILYDEWMCGWTQGATVWWTALSRESRICWLWLQGVLGVKLTRRG